jgi:serine protease AprX
MSSTTLLPEISPATGQTLHRRGLTGRGVGIAVIDSGVSAPDAFGDRLVIGPDATADGGTDAHGLDRTGHGTHLAGIAAGARTGVAPGAHVVSVKVAGEGGATDPMDVVAAIDWAVANRRQLQLGVVLLAFGADQLGMTDPLAEAVARAWRAGLVVVTSAGNEGDAPLPTPAHIDQVLTVGAAELVDGAWQRCDFSNIGRAGERADLLAPGASVVGPVAPGAVEAPESSFVGEHHVKGTGSSQAAAVAAGAAALLLEADPGLTPDEVKAVLTASAIRIDDPAAGAGTLDLEVALAYLASGLVRDQGPRSLTPAGAQAWTTNRWTGLEWATNRWTTNRWTGLEWATNRWTTNRWTGLEWATNRWTTNRWTGLEWATNRWTTNRWTGLEWATNRWTTNRWTGLEWATNEPVDGSGVGDEPLDHEPVDGSGVGDEPLDHEPVDGSGVGDEPLDHEPVDGSGVGDEPLDHEPVDGSGVGDEPLDHEPVDGSGVGDEPLDHEPVDGSGVGDEPLDHEPVDGSGVGDEPLDHEPVDGSGVGDEPLDLSVSLPWHRTVRTLRAAVATLRR